MKTKFTLWNHGELRKLFKTDFPDICHAAIEATSLDQFKSKIIDICMDKTITRLTEFDGQTITDFSTGEKVHIQTISLLYDFLRPAPPIPPLMGVCNTPLQSTVPPSSTVSPLMGVCNTPLQSTVPPSSPISPASFARLSPASEACVSPASEASPSPASEASPSPASEASLTDLYFIFRTAFKMPYSEPINEQKVKRWAKYWSTDQLTLAAETQKKNKQHLINKIVYRLERKHDLDTPFILSDALSLEEKRRQVEEWWNNFRFHLYMAIKSPEELNFYLDNTLSDETMQILNIARKKGIPFFITPYYLSLLDIFGQTFNDLSIRSYMLYSRELVETFGEIKAWEKEDKVEPGKANAAGWFLPEGRNIHRRYPEVAIFISDSIGRACGGLCASCQRMYDFQSKRLNFNLKELAPKESWPAKMKKLMTYFEDDMQIRDILITGGDAFMSRNATLRNILEAVYKMALQKKKANESRPDGEKYAEIQCIRLGTRLPAYLPMRVDDELVSILKEFREKASKIGICHFFVQTHFQTPLEMTEEAKEAVRRIISAGWIITNQLVFNVPASRRGHTVALRKVLIENGVIPYYTFTVKGFHENYAVYAPIARSMQERMEEKIFGVLNQDEQEAFVETLQNNPAYIQDVKRFLLNKQLKFAATDRSVLNLPGIGKSMTFRLVGITKEGARIHLFEHDATRKHSPVIESIGKIFITENKSILAYLQHLEQIGCDPKQYLSIWKYTEGATEPRFKLYEYPNFTFRQTDRINHFALL